jgi:TonB family protein
MKRISILFLSLFAIAVSAQYVAAQEQTPKQETAPATSEQERPRNEVEKAMDEARSHGQTVMGTCVEDCEEFDRKNGAELERGRAIQLPKPKYPAIARAGKAEGEVQVQVLIGLDGRVEAAAVVSGHPLLAAASIKAARESVFTATKYQGQPVRVVGVISYNFIPQ